MGSGTDIAMESGGRHAGERRLIGHIESPSFKPGYHAQYPSEPVFAFIYNALGVTVAAGVLYPFSVFCVADDRGRSDEFSSVSVIANALRLRRISL